MSLENRLIVALDVPTVDKASKLIVALGEAVSYYKVGMELFYGSDSNIIDYLKDFRKKVFLDLKLHDIPNTVGNSVEVLTKLGVDMLNVHASGGRKMMEKAVLSAKSSQEKTGKKAPSLIAVTVLTSFDDAGWAELNNKLSIQEQVVELAKLAKDCGMDGVVASPLESNAIKKACGDDFLIVTPGIRLPEDNKDDQIRITTPKEAFQAGSTHIVVGRSITAAKDPKQAARAVLEQIMEV